LPFSSAERSLCVEEHHACGAKTAASVAEAHVQSGCTSARFVVASAT
jgi:hypothetical protein